VETYGYAAVVIGTFLEGETVLILGGVAAHRGYLALPWVVLAAFVGTLSGTQVIFHLGRRRGNAMLEKRPALRKRVERAHRLMRRNQTGLVLLYRFLIGMRSVLPALWGMGNLSGTRFFLLDLVSAAFWAIGVAALGWAIGGAANALIGKIQRYELLLFAAIIAVSLAVWGMRRLRARASAQH